MHIFKAPFVFPQKELCNSLLTSSKKISTHKQRPVESTEIIPLKGLPESLPYKAIIKNKVLI